MFNKLYIFFAGMTNSLADLIVRIHGQYIWIIGGFLSLIWIILSSITYFLQFINMTLTYLFGTMDKLVIGTDVISGLGANKGAFMSFLEIANTFFPVSELCGLMIGMAFLASVCALYGLIRSWLPSIFGVGFPTH